MDESSFFPILPTGAKKRCSLKTGKCCHFFNISYGIVDFFYYYKEDIRLKIFALPPAFIFHILLFLLACMFY